MIMYSYLSVFLGFILRGQSKVHETINLIHLPQYFGQSAVVRDKQAKKVGALSQFVVHNVI